MNSPDNSERDTQNQPSTTLFDFSVFPSLETERLRLRELHTGDAEAVFAFRGDYQVTQYNTGDPFGEIEQAQQLIISIAEDYAQKSAIRWAITLKPDDRVLGLVGFNYWSRQDHRGSIGFELARHAWGKGIMTEALHAVIAFGFDQMGLNRIEADTSIHNESSQRVLRKLGFQQEGHLREQYYYEGEYHDLLMFALLKRDYSKPNTIAKNA